MLGGFNTNVRYKGQTYHVQTEGGGDESSQIVTLLYQGGAILFSKKTRAEHLGPGQGDEQIRACMEEQHRGVVKALKGGKLDAKLGLAVQEAEAPRREPAPGASAGFGASVITDRTLDEVIVAHLAGK